MVWPLETKADKEDSVFLKGYHSFKHRTRHRKVKGTYGRIATCVYAKTNISKVVTSFKKNTLYRIPLVRLDKLSLHLLCMFYVLHI